MMWLSNLAEPEWIQISCTEKLLNDVICVVKTDNINVTTSSYQIGENNLICPNNAISKDTLCFFVFMAEYLLTNWYKVILQTA